MTGVLLGDKPKPRLMIIAEEATPEWLTHFLSSLAPTTRVIADPNELKEIRWKEWDAAVMLGREYYIASHVRVIQFGGNVKRDVPKPKTAKPSSPYPDWDQTSTDRESYATEFIIPENVKGALLGLVRSYLAPFMQGNTRNPYLTPKHAIESFLTDGDGHPLAGIIKRGRHGADWWWLPQGVPEYPRWVAYALQEWSKQDPDRFPSSPYWSSQPQWQTPDEVELHQELTDLQEKRDAFLRELDEKETALKESIDDLSRSVNNRERRLLNAQGDDLVDAVQAALSELGFTVSNSDQDSAEKGDLLEDLQIRDAEFPNWVSLTEVRGYASGAKQNDLLRIGRFVERYIKSTGMDPSSRWYVVNHNIKQDPAARPIPLASSEAEVEIFAESGGLVLDTRDLFRLVMAVRTERYSRSLARKSLRDTVGWYRLSPEAPSDTT